MRRQPVYLRAAWQRGLNPLLYFGQLCCRRDDGTPLTDADRDFIRAHKAEIVAEIKKDTARGRVIDLERIAADFRPRDQQPGQGGMS